MEHRQRLCMAALMLLLASAVWGPLRTVRGQEPEDPLQKAPPQPPSLSGALAEDQQQQTPPPRHHQTMSCHVCSTMDYSNPADNICRNMRTHRAATLGAMGAQLGHSPKPYYSHLATGAPPVDEAAPSSQLLASMNPDTATMIHQQLDANSGLSNNASHLQHPANNNHTKQPHEQAATALQNPQIIHSVHSVQSGKFSNSYVRTRPCFEDETYCSIVSIVRLEFVGEQIMTRFWALERNCSKTCNTGCMIIGEKLRLRVCGQCCNSVNCNNGSGASSSLSIHSDKLLMVVLSTMIIGFTLLTTTIITTTKPLNTITHKQPGSMASSLQANEQSSRSSCWLRGLLLPVNSISPSHQTN